MQELTSKRISMFVLFGGGIALLISIFTMNPIVIVVCAIALLLSLLLWKYGYIVMPAIFKMARIVEVRGEYEIPPSQNCIIKKVGNNYFASMFLGAKITESVTEKSKDEKLVFVEYFERAISSVKSIAKFSVIVHNVDMSEAIDEIKAKRSWCETKKAQLLASEDKNKEAEIARLDREIIMWNRQLERLSSGEKPMEVVSYIMTTAKGLSRDEAINKAKAQALEIKSVVSNALNVEVFNLFGEDMKKCFEWEFFVPSSSSEFKDVTY